MAKFPALPLYTDAYLSDTLALSTLQHGAYLLLLMVAWRTDDCALPDDDKVLARYARLDLRTWKKNRDAVMQFWRLGDDQKWRQGRLSDQRENVEYRSGINSDAGKASALKRKNRNSTNDGTKPQQSFNPQTQTQNQNQNQTPSSQQEDSSSGGVFENGKDGKERPFDIALHLDDKALKSAKNNAPNWDIYYLIRIYNEGHQGAKKPNKPAGAFIAWCLKYTKGKPPD